MVGLEKTIDKIFDATMDFIYGKIDADNLENMYDDYIGYDKIMRGRYGNYLIERFSVFLNASKGSELFYYIITFVIEASNNLFIYKKFLETSLNDNNLTKENKYYLYEYASRMKFLGIVVLDEEANDLLDDLYNVALNGFEEEITNDLKYLSQEQRDNDFVIVLTTQILTLMNGPTKTLFDRSYILEEHLNKKVLIINTAEVTQLVGDIPIFRPMKGNYIEEYSKEKEIEYKGHKFQFYQCPEKMPDIKIIKQIISIVEEKKPLFILTIRAKNTNSYSHDSVLSVLI